ASGRQAGTAARPLLRFDQIGALGDRPDADIARSETEAALIVWTSGTSSAPKGVTLSLANIAYVVRQGVAAHDLDADDRWLSFLPLNHMLELSCGLLAAMATGASFAFVGSSAPGPVATAMAERRCTRMTVVPAFLAALLAHIEATGPAGFPTGRRLSLHCGGAPLDAAVARRLERFGIPVYTGYGLTETAPVVAVNTPAACRPGSVGRPLPGTEVRIATSGEVLVRSPGVMVGYWDDAALTEAAIDGGGWLHTGDLGHLDADGFLHVTGRAKTLIVLANAKKVQPEEVEEVLAGSALLAEACVVGWPVGDADQRVGAVVVAGPALRRRCPSPEALAAAAEGEVARLTAGLAAFKRPVVVRVIDGALPRTAKGSIRRTEVLRLVVGAPYHRSGHASAGPDP
ncbi:MAG: AMP-binding protein, partial [Actinomycetota bacterium]|nr:AMP-binding protein [Actinomycetota bacterium]